MSALDVAYDLYDWSLKVMQAIRQGGTTQSWLLHPTRLILGVLDLDHVLV